MSIPPSPETNNKEKEEVVFKPQRGWIVIVFNDNHHTFNYVIDFLCKLVGVSLDEAQKLANQIHTEGRASVAGPMSRYEALLIANKIASYGPDPWSRRPTVNVGIKTAVEQFD
jgi:ATP-dependent Clp protease adapter protein ClpS